MSEFVETGTENVAHKQETPQVQALMAAEAKLLLQTYARYPILFTHGEGVELFDENNTSPTSTCSPASASARSATTTPRSPPPSPARRTRSSTPATSSTTAAHHRARPPPHGDHRPRPRLLLQLRHRSLGSRTQARPRPRRPAPLRRQAHRHQDPLAGAQLPRPHHGLRLHHPQARLPRALCPAHAATSNSSRSTIPQPSARAFANDPHGFCAIAFECLQGEGGINLVSEEFLRTARELCDETGALLILRRDPVRHGPHRQVVRPTSTSASSPTSPPSPSPSPAASPSAPCSAPKSAARAITPGMHGTTFGGNPLACAVAIAVIDTLRQDQAPPPRHRGRRLLPRAAPHAPVQIPGTHHRRPRPRPHDRRRDRRPRNREVPALRYDESSHFAQQNARECASFPPAVPHHNRARRPRHRGPRRVVR